MAEGAIRYLPPSFDEITAWSEPPAMPDALDPVVAEITPRRRQMIELDKAKMTDHQQRANDRN